MTWEGKGAFQVLSEGVTLKINEEDCYSDPDKVICSGGKRRRGGVMEGRNGRREGRRRKKGRSRKERTVREVNGKE